MVETAGVEVITMLTARKLILGSATRAKKAPLPDPLYVYCTKILLGLESCKHSIAVTGSHRFAEMDGEKHPACYDAASYRLFFGTLRSPPTGRLQNRSVREGDR